MKAKLFSIESDAVSEVELNSMIFGQPFRPDILQRVVEWQRAKKRAGTHKTKTVSEVSGTTKKPFRQKGTGNARQESLRSAQFRKGGVIFGPVVRSHAFDLPKKVRKLGLKIALSARQAEGKLFILKNETLESPKTKPFYNFLEKQGWQNSTLIVSSNDTNKNFAKAVANLVNVDILPQQGLNVYDVLRHQNLVLTAKALAEIEERLNG